MWQTIDSKESTELRFNFGRNDAKKLLFGLIAFELFLVCLHLVDFWVWRPSEWFPFGQRYFSSFVDLNNEGNLPAWFSSFQLFLVGVIFLLAPRRPASSYRPSTLFLCMVGTGFFYLAADEASALHENINDLLIYIEWFPRFKRNHGIWIFGYIALFFAFFIWKYAEFKAMWTNFKYEASMMGLGFILFLLGGVVLEIISYQYLMDGSTPSLLEMEVVLEEFFEMFGISFILYGAILYVLTPKALPPHGDEAPSEHASGAVCKLADS